MNSTDTASLSSLPRFLVLQVISKQQKKEDARIALDELAQLIDTFGGQVVSEIVQRREHPDPASYIGRGKIEEIKQLCQTHDIDVVVVNAQAKSGQLFRIEKELWQVNTKIMVWDRIDLILNIFDQHATTTESKLQIKLARVTHMGPRIYGLGKTELSRQGGGVGTRGKGETNIEFERRQIKIDRQKIQQDLKKILSQKHDRLTKRNQLGIGPVALVGYTSAGKTTLFNTLTGKEKEMNKGLFTTLDTVVGKMKSPDFDQPILVSDTIGFIDNLPPVLFDSFSSTLLESLEAQLLLHVVDASDPQVIHKIEVVEGILEELKATQPTILVLNKSDLLTNQQKDQLITHLESAQLSPTIFNTLFISAETGAHIDTLKEVISEFFAK
jgi:GTP-binding protein HflX